MHPVISRKLKNPLLLYSLLSLAALGLAWPAIQSWSDALIRGLWFHLTEDEAFYAEIIHNLKFRGVYGGWEITPFSPAITGGPAFLLPLAAFAKLSGLNAAIAARIGCLLFHLGTVSFFIALSKKVIPLSRSIPVIALFLFFQVWRGIPENGYMTFGILAESAVTFYLFAALYFLSARRVFWAGVCACLTVLAKPYMVFFPFALLVTELLSRRRDSIMLILGLALPLLLWFSFMGVKLGFSEMIQYWIAYPKAVSTFSGTASVQSPFEKALFHLQHFREAMSLRAWIFTLTGLVVLGLQVFRKNRAEKNLALVCFVFSILHLMWWFFISPGVTSRYLLPVPMVALVGWVGLIQGRNRFFLEKSVEFSPKVFYPILALLMVLGVTKKIAPEWKKNFGNYDSCLFCRQIFVLDEWQKIHSTGELKPIWVSTGTHTADRDLLFTAPAHIQRIDTATDLSKIQAKDWVSVSDYTQPFFRTWVSEHCMKKINPPLQTIGLWECP